ncbi:MAG TPA: hypothetical protein VGR58_10860, partial [Candidatus Acidoferrum sp.]|nr:hypothetical protein [Candidatus Acidoferrum sp.]
RVEALSALRGSARRSAAAKDRIKLRHSFAFGRNMLEAAPVVLSAVECSGGLAAGQARMDCSEITGSADGISGGKEYTPLAERERVWWSRRMCYIEIARVET